MRQSRVHRLNPRNQPRKRLDIAAKAFGLFAQKHDDVRYHHHAGIQDSGWNMPALARRYDWSTKLIITSRDLSPQKYVSDEVLNLIYNSADVGLNTCYAPGTKVLTTTGYTSIESVSVGDKVFTHTGKESVVENTFIFKCEEKILNIIPYGAPAFRVTPDHKLFADPRSYKNIILPELEFIKTKDLSKGSVLSYPVIKAEHKTISSELAFIYGAYLAEGSTSKSGIRFSLNSGFIDDLYRQEILTCMKNVFNLNGHTFNYSRNRQTIEYYSVQLKREFEKMFGVGARNKRVPEELLFLNREAKIEFLRGHFLGDGHNTPNQTKLSFCTTSENLGWSIWFMLTTLGGIAPSLDHKSRGEYVVKVFGDSAINLGKLFRLPVHVGSRKQKNKMWANNEYVFYPIRKISEESYSGNIHDLQVAGEHSYVTHVAGHNSLGEGWGLCFTEDADVLTEDGYKSIRDVTIGDFVFDRQGQLTKVTNVFRRDYDGTLNKIKVAGLSSPILVTPEHPFYTEKFDWVEAQDLTTTSYLFKPEISFKSDVVYTDLVNYESFVHDDRYLYLNRLRNDIGEKIATRNIQKIRRLFNKYISKNMVKKVSRRLPIDTSLALILSHIMANLPASTHRFFYDSKVEKSLLELLNYSRPSNTKNLYPGETLVRAFNNMAFDQSIYMAMSLETLKVFFYDLLSRAGYSHPTNKRLLLAAQSQEKQRILRLVLQRLGIAWSEFVIKDGTIYFSLDKRYLKDNTDKPNSKHHRTEDIDGYYFKVLSNTTEEYTGKVYNLETEDHTYTVFGYVVHNCNMEHATVGKPQIIPANSANLELYIEDRGIFVPISHYDTNTTILTEGAVVSPRMVAKALEYAYQCRDEVSAIGKKSMEYFLREKFSWKSVANRFISVIEE